MCSAASPSAARRVPAAADRLATSASLPSCWIADTGCGHDLLCQQHIAKHGQECRTRVPAPPQFSGVGGCMTANMKLPLKSLALQSEVDPFVLPATPAVLSVGRRCVRKGWAFYWPPWSKRPVLTPPKGKGKPIYLKVVGDIPYVCEPRSQSRLAAFGPVTSNVSVSTSVGSEPGSSCASEDVEESGSGTPVVPSAPAKEPKLDGKPEAVVSPVPTGKVAERESLS